MTLIIRLSALLAVFFISCSSPEQKKENWVKANDIPALDSILKAISVDPADTSFISKLKPVFGNRFSIKGDFNGDGKQETLTEHYISGITRKEINKYYDSIEYDQQVEITIQNDPYSFLTSDNKDIDTLHIAHTGQLFGILYIKNEGDLNGDGTDEISYVVDWADFSGLNSLQLVTYKNNKWIKLYSFTIMEYQLPEWNNNDTLPQKPLIQKVSNNKIKILSLYNKDGEDFGAEENYFLIDLRNPSKKF